jgi:hypothetical protein
VSAPSLFLGVDHSAISAFVQMHQRLPLLYLSLVLCRPLTNCAVRLCLSFPEEILRSRGHADFPRCSCMSTSVTGRRSDFIHSKASCASFESQIYTS